MDRSPYHLIVAVAATQWGLFTTQQAFECGFTSDGLRWASRPSAPFERVATGVYQLRDYPPSTLQPLSHRLGGTRRRNFRPAQLVPLGPFLVTDALTTLDVGYPCVQAYTEVHGRHHRESLQYDTSRETWVATTLGWLASEVTALDIRKTPRATMARMIDFMATAAAQATTTGS
jgi:hypothetical protein